MSALSNFVCWLRGWHSFRFSPLSRRWYALPPEATRYDQDVAVPGIGQLLREVVSWKPR